MKLEDFNNLTEEEKATYLNSIDNVKKQLEDVTAERDSFKAENSSLIEQNTASNKELKATKELNFTLARKINIGAQTDPETELYEFIKGVRT